VVKTGPFEEIGAILANIQCFCLVGVRIKSSFQRKKIQNHLLPSHLLGLGCCLLRSRFSIFANSGRVG